MAIDTVTIVGLGALGTMYTDFLAQALPAGSVRVLADEPRAARYREQGVTCNGRRVDGRVEFVSPQTEGDPADLVIFATKYGALPQAMEEAANQVGPDTAIISVLNGVTSESDLAQRFGAEKVLACVAQEMDATRQGLATTYGSLGRLALGVLDDDPRAEARLESVEDLFYDVELPFFEPADIRRQLWNKLMLNVGVNQTCMVYGCGYAGVQTGGAHRDEMLAAMRETAAVARAQGIGLGEEDVKNWIRVLDGLDAANKPSMQQDAEARRPSEVDLFGGTVCRLGRELGVPTPVNDSLVARIRQMEAGY